MSYMRKLLALLFVHCCGHGAVEQDHQGRACDLVAASAMLSSNELLRHSINNKQACGVGKISL